MAKWGEDLTGKKFGQWVVIRKSSHPRYRGYWRCKCSCGKIKNVYAGSLRNGNSTSCGCFQKKLARQQNTTHGMSRTREYKAWRSMLNRCYQPNNSSFNTHGGRGIVVCKQWINSFEQFIKDVGKSPSRGHSLDRIDNNGNYEPDNVRWTTFKEQGRNRRDNTLITFQGETKCLVEWAEDYGIGVNALSWRLQRWSIEKSLLTPVRNKKKHKAPQE